MPHTRPSRSKVRAVAERAVKGKLLTVLAVAGAVLLVAIVTISLLFSAAAVPALALKEPIRWLFGSSTETDTNPNPGDTEDLRTCLGVDAAVLETVMRSVPAATDPELARAWILYALAHPDTAALDTPAEGADPSEPTAGSESATFAAFADRWPLLTAPADRTSGTGRIDPVPAELTALDPVSDYHPFISASMVAVLELSYRGTISMDDTLTASTSAEVSERCASTTHTPTG
ncbi:hypothetical protein [Rhodococcus sp. BS-15]|uniref:hypothetical protein n=1 Tax=Rhodococcus sp. BS-15 TaxID=1304954 RepID=UPI000B218E85|nr:hypothetical protein [Rhodococcus sp. BS-15]